jgi:hypothetical protein
MLTYQAAVQSMKLLLLLSAGFCHWPQPAWRRPDGTWVPSQANFTSLASPDAVGSGKTVGARCTVARHRFAAFVVCMLSCSERSTNCHMRQQCSACLTAATSQALMTLLHEGEFLHVCYLST